MSIRDTVLTGIQAVAADQALAFGALTDDCLLLETGLDSLGFAILASRLAAVVGCDPFACGSNARFPRTIGELVAVYDAALV
jgi:hypothetical protein